MNTPFVSSRLSRPMVELGAAVVAIPLLVVLGALQSTIWNGEAAPAFARSLALTLEPALAAFGPASNRAAEPPEIYFGYGRQALAAYFLLGVAFWALRPALGRRGFIAVGVLGGVALLGDVLAYWVSESAGPAVRQVGFWYVELPALVALAAMLSGVGVVHVRRKTQGRLLALALPLGLGATAGLRYLPHGLLLGLAVVCALALGCEVRGGPRARHPALLGLSVVLLVGLWVQYRPRLVIGRLAATTRVSVPVPSSFATLHVFETGSARMSPLLVGHEHPWRPVPAFVIDHPTLGLIVFDTGLSDEVELAGASALPVPERWLMSIEGRPELSLPAQMRAAGLAPEQVKWVVLSHLHDDHLGELGAFPNAQFLGGPGTSQFAAQRGLVERWHEQGSSTAVALGPFSKVVEPVPGSGLWLVLGGGHTREDLMLLVRLEQGPVLLAGDAVVHRDWLNSLDVQRIAVDPVRAADVRNEVRAFLAGTPGAQVIFGHDTRGVPCTWARVECHLPQAAVRSSALTGRRP